MAVRSARSFLLRFVSSRGSSTFCSAVSTGSRLYDWKTKPIVRARHAASCPGLIALTSSPATRTVPRVGLSSPATRFSSVDLPDPEGPISAVKLPSSKSIERSLYTSTVCASRLKDLSTLRISTRGIVETVGGGQWGVPGEQREQWRPKSPTTRHPPLPTESLRLDLHPFHGSLDAPGQKLLSAAQPRADLEETTGHG